MTSFEAINALLTKENQTHLLRFWEQFTNEERENYLQHLATIGLDGVSKFFERAANSMNDTPDTLDHRMKPIPPSQFESEECCSSEVLENYRNQGFLEISEGNVAVLLLAGGQGTRLGVNYPKGMYSVGLPSGKTLFQIQAERIRSLQSLAQGKTDKPGTIYWYIMTSGPTNKSTEKYLKANNYFGLNPKNVILFKQGLLPCFDFNGQILLEEKNFVALAPDGNGGIYRALAQNGILKDMEKRGVKYVHVHSVDNILVKVADPVFIGYCVAKKADCGAKVVKKAGPSEAVGVVCQVDDRFQVVEYSEITEETASLRDDQGNLVFNAGNICNHFFTVQFLQQVAYKHEKELKLHVAKKKIPYIDEAGNKKKPTVPNGIKIEKFIFDVFQFSNNFVTWEVPRSSEFSALKNADDAKKDCPSTAKNDLITLHKSYIEKAGGTVLDSAEVEISPLLSYDGENLESKVKGKVFDSTTVLAADEERQINGSINGLANEL